MAYIWNSILNEIYMDVCGWFVTDIPSFDLKMEWIMQQ